MSDYKTKPESNLDKLYDEIEKDVKREQHDLGKQTEETTSKISKINKDQNEVLRFFGGMLLFGAGMFMILQNLIVTSSWGAGSIFRIGRMDIPNGTIMIPLLIGIALLFLLDRKLWGWLFIAIGFVIVIAAVIMSVNIQWRTSNGWTFFVMFAMTFAGGAMMLREVFRKQE